MIKAVDSAKASGITRRSVPGRRPLAQWIAAALAMGAAMQAHAGNPPVLSQAWLAAQRGQPGTSAAGNVTTPVPNNLSVQSAPQLLQQRVVQQSIANLNQAAQAVAAQLSAQQVAQQAAQQLASPVPDGIAAGGLQVSADVVRNPALWQNANAPVQTASAGKTTVEVKQTAAKAILTWDSFNVGRNTTLYFNQSGGNQSNGGNDWIALNRINDPSGAPSQIFGKIKAEGSVYLINRNGILFGAGSQVNTHSLLASSLSLFSSDVATSNARFLKGGIADQASANAAFLVDGVFTDGRRHDVVIEKGASISTGKQGFALVAAPHVSNAGAIVADDGQAILAGGTAFFNPAGSDSTGAALRIAGWNDGQGIDGSKGDVVNTGLVQARRGSVRMVGHDVTQAGVALASTSVAYPGSIELNARDQANGSGSSLEFTRGGALVLTSGSVTAVLPEKDGSTTSSSVAADAAFKGSTLSLDGATVTLRSGSLLEAPGAALAIAAHAYTIDTSPTAGRVYVDAGAVIDVSGLANVALPMSALLVNVSRIGQNELANSPLLRNGFLYTQKNVLVDSTQSGTRADGLDWVGSPILNVGGYVDNVPRGVEQLMTKGGTVSLHGSEVILRSGSELNLDGGFLSYQAGWVTTPNLLGANGRIYDIAAADPDMTYVGFAGQYTQEHVRWGISQTYNNGMLAGSRRWDPGFIAGGDAGTLDVQAGHALVLDGDISAQSFAGRNQVEQGKQPVGGTFKFTVPQVGLDTRYNYAPGILLQQASLALDGLSPGFDADTAWDTVTAAQSPNTSHDSDLRWWLPISTGMLSSGGFSNVKLSTGNSGSQILQQAGSVLAVRPGGSVSLTGSRITVWGDISAASGSIDMTSTGPAQDTPAMDAADGSTLRPDITVGDGATLSTRGLWVNDAGLAAEQRVGSRYIDGGKITLTANAALTGSDGSDATGSVVLGKGSTLDVSGGGYVGADARVLTKNGVPAGSGGDISLSTYGNVAAEFQQAAALDSGTLQLDGKLLGYGFSGGGTLSLQANYIQIGGDRTAMPMANGLYLDPSFFAGKGFDQYKLTAITDGIVAPGAQVRVARDNFLPDYQALLAAPTGADLYAVDAAHPQGIYASVGSLDAYHRYVTRDASAGPGFSLSAGQYLDWPIDPSDPSQGAPQYAGVNGSVRVGDGSSIAVDAGGSITLAGTQATTVLGTLTAHGGTVDVSTRALTRPDGLPSLTQRVWLGESAVLDASGIALIDPWAAAVAGADGRPQVPRTGIVLDGGAVSLKGRGGYVVAEQGSRVDVSGAADNFQLPTKQPAGMGNATSYVATPVWSDAGSITLGAAAGLYFDGQLQASGGAADANGGTLTLLGLGKPPGQNAPSASGVLIQQSGLLLPSGARIDGAVDAGTPSGVLRFAADRISGSGITTLAIGLAPSTLATDGAKVVPLGFAGDVNLSLGRAFIVNTTAIQALPADATTMAASAGAYASGNGQVSIKAPYVSFIGGVAPTSAPVAMAGDGKLSVQANYIDMGGWLNLQRWAEADFESASDIRFQAPALLAYATGKPQPGLLFSTGNLTFKAAQLYPGTDYRFAIVANGSGLSDANGNALNTTLSILPNGSSATPLSAGGTLLLSADHIEQQGTVRAPSGSLVLGVTDAVAQAAAFGVDPKLFPFAITQSVHLAPGSLTSVSLGSATVPYGSTIDGVQWRYDADPVVGSPDLTAPPSKQIALNGADLALDAGAGIDLSGGGHLQAAEWVAGTGGTRDVLAQYGTSYQNGATGTQVPQYADGRAIYAILPGYSAPVAAYDPAFAKQGGDGPSVGQSVYLSGAPGLAAGYYTLLPARYATLPGAYRVVQDTGSRDSVLGSSAVQPDGTLAISGYFADALSGARDARNTTFLVQSGKVWQQYSQYTLSDADTFFAKLAQKGGKVAPALAADAGRLTLAATSTLDLGATLTSAPAKGGRGSQVDIAALAIQVVGADTAARDGYLTLSADGLSTLGAGSLLLGGTRRTGDDGDHVTAVADSVVLANDAAHPLQGQEILLVANGGQRDGAMGVSLQQGSVLRATGQGSGAASLPLVFGVAAGTDANGQPIAGVSGDGALLRVSQNGAANIVRNSVSANPGGALAIAAGARVDGGSALTLDATGSTSVDASSALSAQTIDANSNRITFLGDGATAPSGSNGFVIGRDTLNLLRGAQSVTLRSRGDMDFLGNVRVDLANDLNLSAGAFASDGGSVDIEAGKLGLSNDLGAANGTFTAGAGQFAVRANEVDFGAGNTGLRGFGGFSASAAQGMQGQGTGRFDFGSVDVNLNTPWLLAADGADTQLATTGALNIGGTAGTVPAGHMGGALSLTGGSVSIGTAIAAPAGRLDVHATSGDIAMASGALLTVGGVNKTFFDTTTYAQGGTLTLTSDHGSVGLANGATLDFSGAAAGGDAGSLDLEAGNALALAGTLRGQAKNGYRGGYLTLGSGASMDLDVAAGIAAAAGATGLFSLNTGAGDLHLSAGNTLRAQKVYLGTGGGIVSIDGTIDASANAGSRIELYGERGVDVAGSLIATSAIPMQRGGSVVIGTGGTGDGTVNADYGYEIVQSAGSGYIHFGPQARIDVSGGSVDAFSGGSVSLRAPLLADGDVRIALDGGNATIKGARVVTLEPYARWSTADGSSDPSKHFDGLIDPAGWYVTNTSGGTPTMVDGTWTDASGKILAAPADATQLKQYLQNDYFMPKQVNADHAGFYGYIDGDASKGPGTLMRFVQQPGYAFGDRYAGIANLQLRPGIELVNPAGGTRGGDIAVLTNWNLGAGTTQPDGSIALAYRYQGLAPILTVRAAGNLDIQASITDGFYQQNSGAALANPPAPPPPPPPPVSDNGYANAVAAYTESQSFLDANGLWNGSINLADGSAAQGKTPGGGTADISHDPYYEPLQAPLKDQSAAYYTNYQGYIGEFGNGTTSTWVNWFQDVQNTGMFLVYNPTPVAVPAPQPADYAVYKDYTDAYDGWLQQNYSIAVRQRKNTPPPVLLPLDADYGSYSSNYVIYLGEHNQYANYVYSSVGNSFFGTQLFYAPFAPKADPANPLYGQALAAYQASQAYLDANGLWNGSINLADGSVAQGKTPGGGTADISHDPYYQPLQAPLPGQSANYYANYQGYINEFGNGTNDAWVNRFSDIQNGGIGFLAYNPTPLVAPQPSDFTAYKDYVDTYDGWLHQNFSTALTRRRNTPSPVLLPLDTDYNAYTSNYAVYLGEHYQYADYVYNSVGNSFFGTQLFYAPFAPKSDPAQSGGGGGPPTTVPVPASAANNSPSNMPSLGSPVSLASATLLGGSSTSYRLVAGARTDATDPLATVAGAGNVNLSNHFAVVDTLTPTTDSGQKSKTNGKAVLLPTVVRTGTGSIDIASGGDLNWQDAAAPAVIYTGGAPAQDTAADTNASVIRPNWLSGNSASITPYILSTGQVNPEHGGDLTLDTRGSIHAIQQVIDVDGSATTVKGADISQYWWPWMQTANAADGSASSINFANFGQGVMSAGGNVAVSAGGDIHQLSVSLPTTWRANADGQSVTTYGGGDLDVRAGGDILSGTYFVAKGQGNIQAGGSIGSDFRYTAPATDQLYAGQSTPVSTLFALQDAQLDVRARVGADIGGVYNPSYLSVDPMSVNALFLPAGHGDAQSYSATSSFSAGSSSGNIAFDSLRLPGALFDDGDAANIGNPGSILPATLSLAALSGNVDIRGAGALYPSAQGNLSVLAGQNVLLSQQVSTMQGIGNAYGFGLIDAPPSLLPSPLNPFGDQSLASIYGQLWTLGYLDGGATTYASMIHAKAPLHADDAMPARIYALQGDIVDGILSPAGFQYRSLQLTPAKPVLVRAGRDIVNLSLLGQQSHDADVTLVSAGRDIYDLPINQSFQLGSADPGAYQLAPALLLGGPGSFLIEAGRNIGPLTNKNETTRTPILLGNGNTGIDTVGNQFNPYLPHASADINLLYGIGPGIATADFMAHYVDAAAAGLDSLMPDLVSFMERRVAGRVVDTGYAQDKVTAQLTAAEARQLFDQEPDYVQRQFVSEALFKVLAKVGADYNDKNSAYFGKYARGYAAIDTLFPAGLGYTANGSGQGGLNGAQSTVDTGDLDLRGTTIQTQQGGNITMLAPGGQALLGSASAPPVITDSQGKVLAGPNSMGVLTLEQGDIRMFTDRSVLLAQSRIFTEQGGDLVLWSSNGDINAGQGAKTTTEIPPPSYLCTIDAWCRLDARGQVSGAGIASLQSVPDALRGNVYLVAPRGTVDAGDAGIRVSGNLIVAAARVANADNIQVQGEKVGVPVTQSVNVGALNAASAAASAVSKAAEDMARQQQDDTRSKLPSVISVQVLGVGDGSASLDNGNGAPRRYDPSSPVQVLGGGMLSTRAKEQLTAEERKRLTE